MFQDGFPGGMTRLAIGREMFSSIYTLMRCPPCVELRLVSYLCNGQFGLCYYCTSSVSLRHLQPVTYSI